jgi:dienelactone hydrolase
VNYSISPSFETERRIPILTVEPESKQPETRPKVLLVHGLYGCKESWLPLAYRLAKEGMTAVIVDMRNHGERSDALKKEEWAQADFLKMAEETVYGTAADIRSLIDTWSLCGETLGMVGVSMGGCVGHVLAQTEKRITAMSLALSSPDWRVALPQEMDSNSPLGEFLFSLSPMKTPENYAPLALQMILGDGDQRMPPESSIELAKSLEPYYEESNFEGRIECKVYPGLGHELRQEQQDAIVDWLKRWLIE